MKSKLAFGLFCIGLLSALIAIFVTAGAFRGSAEKQTRLDLRAEAELVAKEYPGLSNVQDLAKFASRTLRVTLISPSGQVLVESDANARAMTNHRDRVEVREALRSGYGESYRPSLTLATDLYYCAIRLNDGNILRLSLRKSSAAAVFSSVYPALAILLFCIFFISIIVARFLSERFMRPIQKLAEDLESDAFAEGNDFIYKEFVPFVAKIRAQRSVMNEQMKRIENERGKLAVLIQNMPEGFILLDPVKNVLVINDVAKHILHVIERASSPRNILYFSRDIALNRTIDAAATGKRAEENVDFSGRAYQVIANPVSVNGALSGIICLLLDVTEKKNFLRIKEEFTANASHELKTPLTTISGYAEMLENGMVRPEDVVPCAAKIHTESNRLLALVNDIMKLSELDEGQGREVNAPVESVDLLGIARECAAELSPVAKNRGVSISVEGTPFAVKGNARMLQELVYNLMDNAIRYNREGGSVEVRTEGRTLRVKDTGIGIPGEHRDRVFERFYRVDKSRSKATGGTGLGLAIVKHVAENHGAKISLESEPGKGSEFRVTFP
jgi:two-component system phosphate regulon sensor histidine kinase PhoR